MHRRQQPATPGARVRRVYENMSDGGDGGGGGGGLFRRCTKANDEQTAIVLLQCIKFSITGHPQKKLKN